MFILYKYIKTAFSLTPGQSYMYKFLITAPLKFYVSSYFMSNIFPGCIIVQFCNCFINCSGYPGGRHLSERDLPSKVLGEHNQDSPAPSHLHQAPRMQASKSVPSLNSKSNIYSVWLLCVYLLPSVSFACQLICNIKT